MWRCRWRHVLVLCCYSGAQWLQLSSRVQLGSTGPEFLQLVAGWQAWMVEIARRGAQRIPSLVPSRSDTMSRCYRLKAPSSCNAFWLRAWPSTANASLRFRLQYWQAFRRTMRIFATRNGAYSALDSIPSCPTGDETSSTYFVSASSQL